MDGGDADQVGALLGIEGGQVGLMLEVVGIHFAVFGGGVGHDIVIEGLDLQGVAGLSQFFLGDLQDFGVGGGGGSDDDGLVVRLAAATDKQAQSQDQGQCDGDDLLHNSFSLLVRFGQDLFLSRLSQAVDSLVPMLWKIWTRITRPMTAAHMTMGRKLYRP